MSREQGFARGDIDTAFPLDDKFLALRARLSPELYHQASSVYWHVVAAMWREAERKPASRICPEMPGAIAELIAEGLLDADGRVPRRAYTNSVGRALANRRAAADRKARSRAGMSQPVPRDSRATARDSAPLGKDGSDVFSTSSLRGGSGGNTDPFDAAMDWLSQHRAGISSGSATGVALARLADQHGAQSVVDAFERLLADDESLRDGSQFVYGARKLLNPIPDVRSNGRPAAREHINTEDLASATERV